MTITGKVDQFDSPGKCGGLAAPAMRLRESASISAGLSECVVQVFKNVKCVRESEILVEQQPPLICDHAGLIINKCLPVCGYRAVNATRDRHALTAPGVSGVPGKCGGLAAPTIRLRESTSISAGLSEREMCENDRDTSRTTTPEGDPHL